MLEAKEEAQQHLAGKVPSHLFIDLILPYA
jgi:hypothetical protein